MSASSIPARASRAAVPAKAPGNKIPARKAAAKHLSTASARKAAATSARPTETIGPARAPSAAEASAGVPRPEMIALRETVSKISVSLPDSLARAVRDFVGPGRVSAYVAAAVQRQIELDRLAQYVAAVEQDLGRPISDELMAEAEAAWHAE